MLLECGHEPSEHSSISTGYATDPSTGNRSCYECCATQDADWMAKGLPIPLYDTDTHVTNWPGSLKIRITSRNISPHNIAGTRHHITFTFAGLDWYGDRYGDSTELVLCHPYK